METLKTLRAAAAKHGLTFKAVNAYVNGSQAYAVFSRSSGEQLSSPAPLSWWKEAQAAQGVIAEY